MSRRPPYIHSTHELAPSADDQACYFRLIKKSAAFDLDPLEIDKQFTDRDQQ